MRVGLTVWCYDCEQDEDVLDSTIRPIDHRDAFEIHPAFHARCAEREDSFFAAEPVCGSKDSTRRPTNIGSMDHVRLGVTTVWAAAVAVKRGGTT